MFRQSPEILSCLQSALKSADGNIHLALQYLVMYSLKKNSNKEINSSIDILLELNANPGFSSEKFKDLIKSEFKCPDFEGGWSAIQIICRGLPTNENNIQLTATLLSKLRELNTPIPMSFLEAMFDKIEQASLRKEFYSHLHTFLSDKLKNKINTVISATSKANEIEMTLSLNKQSLFAKSTATNTESKQNDKSSPSLK